MPRPTRLLLALLLPALACSAAGPAPAEMRVRTWPEPPAEPIVALGRTLDDLSGFEVAIQGPAEPPLERVRKIKRPSGVAFDARGRLLVSDSRQGVLLQIDPDLGVVLILGSGTSPRLEEPMGVAVAREGTIFVADAGLRQVLALDPRGTLDRVYGQGRLVEPLDVALSPDGSRLYVADAGADVVAIFERESGRLVETLGGRGKNPAEFYLPTAVEFDRDGNLMVVDQLNARVQLFDASHSFRRALASDPTAGFSRPRDVAVDAAGRLYLTDSAHSRIRVYDPNLEPLVDIGTTGLREGEFLGIGAVAAHGSQLAVLDHAGGRVQLFLVYGVEAPSPDEAQPAVAAAPRARAEAGDRPAPPAPVIREMPEPRLPIPDPPAGGRRTAETPAPEAAPEPPAATASTAAPSPATDRAEPVPDATPDPESDRAPNRAPAAGAAEPAPDEAARIAQEATDLVRAWASAWSAQEVDRYLSFYAESFQPSGNLSRERWAEQRRQRLTAPRSIGVEVDILETRIEDGTVTVTFDQSYTSNLYSDRVRKTLRMVEQAGDWKIVRETVAEEL